MLQNMLLNGCLKSAPRLQCLKLRQKLYFGFRVRASSTLSRTGFNDYEAEKRSFRFSVPSKYNFASDVIDEWALKEVRNESKRQFPAFWFLYSDGRQVKWSFSEVSENSKKVARMLEDHCRLSRGEHAMVLLPKLPEYWLINIAAIRAGVILSSGNTQLTLKDLKYRIEAFKPKCIFAHPCMAEIVEEAVVFSTCVKTKVLISSNEKEREGWLLFHDLFQRSSSAYKTVSTFSDETMMVFFTSGTTGFPKMVEHTHASYGYSLGLTGRYFMDLTEENVMWNLSDTGWAKTAYGNIFGPWSQGACVFVHEMPRYSSSVVLKVLSEFPVDTFCAAPTVYRMLIQENFCGFCFKKLSHCLSGGEPLNPDVANEWMKRTNLRIFQGYGQTETVMLLGMYKCLSYKPGSIGKPPPGTEISILDEHYNQLGPFKEGQISVKRTCSMAAGIFKGYKNEPGRTADRFTQDYFLTGDIAYYDDEGYFWFVGRNDDIISSSGYRIGPHEVESVLMEHPYVSEAAVTSSPDKIRGEIVAAYIVLKKSHKTSKGEELKKELQEHVKKTTAPYKYPRKINFVEDLPRTFSGKIRRSELKKKEWEGHVVT